MTSRGWIAGRISDFTSPVHQCTMPSGLQLAESVVLRRLKSGVTDQQRVEQAVLGVGAEAGGSQYQDVRLAGSEPILRRMERWTAGRGGGGGGEGERGNG